MGEIISSSVEWTGTALPLHPKKPNNHLLAGEACGLSVSKAYGLSANEVRGLFTYHILSAVKTYKLPGVLDLKFAHQLLTSILSLTAPKTVSFDWSDCKKIDNRAHCMVLHLRDAINDKKLEVQHLGNEHSSGYSMAEPILNYQFGGSNNNASGIFISPILVEECLFNDKNRMKWFYDSIAIESYDYTSIENIFSELYMNVCQHSGSQKGYIFIEIPNKEGVCNMFFSDIGIGISDNIKSYYTGKVFKNDAEAIAYATKLNITTKSTQQNQGKGLANLLLQSKGMDAFVELYANEGLVIHEKNETHQVLPFYNKGTLIKVCFNLRNLPLNENVDDYIGEI